MHISTLDAAFMNLSLWGKFFVRANGLQRLWLYFFDSTTHNFHIYDACNNEFNFTNFFVGSSFGP